MKAITTISTTNKFKGNPRIITEKQFSYLTEHLEALGDLSGVIYCHNNKAFVGGNQRSEVFNGAQIELIEVDYSQDLMADGSPAFELLERPNGGYFTTKHAGYKPDLYFKAPSIPDWTVFTIRGIYAKMDTIKYESFGWGTRYLIRVK